MTVTGLCAECAAQADPHVGRVDAAYGGVFIVLSLLWDVSPMGLRLTVGIRWEQASAWLECSSSALGHAVNRTRVVYAGSPLKNAPC